MLEGEGNVTIIAGIPPENEDYLAISYVWGRSWSNNVGKSLHFL